MESKLMKSELLCIEEHPSCQNYMTTIETGFKYLGFDKSTEFEEDTTSKNYLLFFLKGDFTITCNQFRNRLLHAGEMILIPRSSRLKGIGENGSSLLSVFFDMPRGNRDKLILQSLSGIYDHIEYDFAPIGIHYPLTPFLGVLTHCIENEMNYAHLHTLMQREFFFLLHGFYEKREIATLLHPIIGKGMDFKNSVIRNHTRVDNIEQLILLSNLGRSRFFSKFDEMFGMTAKQWMLKRKNQRILEKMTEPGVYIKDAVEELGFDSQSNSNRHCKLYFGYTAKQLVECCQSGDYPVYEGNHATCIK